MPFPSYPPPRRLLGQLLHVFCLHGIPSDIVSDWRPQFTSSLWREFYLALGATVSLSSGFNPQSNDQTECLNQDLETMLHCLKPAAYLGWKCTYLSSLLCYRDLSCLGIPSLSTSPFSLMGERMQCSFSPISSLLLKVHLEKCLCLCCLIKIFCLLSLPSKINK